MTTTTLMDAHRNREARLLTGVGVLVCGTGVLTSVAPGVEHAITVALIVAVALTGLLLTARCAARKVREHYEDQADTATAAAWQAHHGQAPSTRGVA